MPGVRVPGAVNTQATNCRIAELKDLSRMFSEKSKSKMDYREDIIMPYKSSEWEVLFSIPLTLCGGLGLDATKRRSRGKIFQIKKRNEDKSLIILVNGLAMLERYVEFVPEAADKPDRGF